MPAAPADRRRWAFCVNHDPLTTIAASHVDVRRQPLSLARNVLRALRCEETAHAEERDQGSAALNKRFELTNQDADSHGPDRIADADLARRLRRLGHLLHRRGGGAGARGLVGRRPEEDRRRRPAAGPLGADQGYDGRFDVLHFEQMPRTWTTARTRRRDARSQRAVDRAGGLGQADRRRGRRPQAGTFLTDE